ncbi:MAG: EF-hand domain-containing protein [Sphingomicrobium sp.]
MPFPALLLPLIAAGVVAPEPPISVVGHAWAPFISPMGEPFRAHSPVDDTLADWFNQADRNHDGMLTQDEMVGDAERFFAKLDDNHDGEIDPDELAQYEWDIAPDIQVMAKTRRMPGEPNATRKEGVGEEPNGDGEHRSRRDRGRDNLEPGGLQGASRYAILNIPEPVAAADTDFNRGISIAEFRQAAINRFHLLDGNRAGNLVLTQLQALRPVLSKNDRHSKPRSESRDKRVGNPLPPGD